ncbi:mTERF domain-containing protein 1, mitochondrial [Symbiodinium microadriaticum]|uniref:mTERF domain-containing protein 1, mitochondrial n=1 Tax=Symbiodinium microadriaticum TaxID=2951 RepID=A0A1Q9CVE7_SYMMI|nr:mTERF domain-containing protein 1, mitochondrial [Symbiodinium microadriaticum]
MGSKGKAFGQAEIVVDASGERSKAGKRFVQLTQLSLAGMRFWAWAWAVLCFLLCGRPDRVKIAREILVLRVATKSCFVLLKTCCFLEAVKGRPRTTHRSYAEVELLSGLAELLMPGEPIGELFRDFPVEPSDAWGSRWLCPDITAFGVLKEEDAALFVEYDGHPRHYEEQGQEADERKTEALLEYAPPGSCILRVGHSARDLRRTWNSKQVVVDTWPAGQERSLMHVVREVVQALLGDWGDVLRKDVCEHLCTFVETEASPGPHQASKFTSEAVFTGDVETKKTNVIAFLEQELKFSKKGIRALARKFPRIWGISIEGKLKPLAAWFTEVGLSPTQVAKVVAGFPRVLGYSIDGNLKPTVGWLEDVGLSREQVAKVVAGFPAVLGCSIEANLKPTVAWLEDVGLSRQQAAKVVAGFPAVLGCSIDDNLKPTVAWLGESGLSRVQVAKVVARHPAVLSYSIDGNLKPTVAWLEDVGLSRKQVSKVVATHPQVLGYSIDGNLKPTVAWLEDVGLSREQVAKVVATHPQVLGYSIDGNLKPTLACLEAVGLSRKQVAEVVAGFPQVLGLSIDGSLKPTVAWLEDVGLSRQQVSKVVSNKPQVFGYSIENNLSRKHILLQQFFSKEDICSMIVYLPPMLGLSYTRLLHRLKVLQEYDCLCKLARVMALTDAKFTRRFPCIVSRHCASEIIS